MSSAGAADPAPRLDSLFRRRAAGARSPARRTIFVGDVHGCCAEFLALLKAVRFAPGSDRLLLTGDAFTRGPDPEGVWQAIRAAGAEMVLGNHEEALLPRLRAVAAAGAPRDGARGNAGPGHGALAALAPHAAKLAAWLETVPLWIDDPRFLLVHAGVNPQRGLAGSTRAELLTIRTWPPVGGIVGPRWHDHVAPGKLIVFGHDAPGGLVVKRPPETPGAPPPPPYLVGLDSGCVFGRQLSAYLLEDDRIVQVRARRRYAPFGRGM